MPSTVLVLEDDPTIRDLLATVLSDDGLDVLVCESPERVMELGRRSPHSLALVDFWGHSYDALSEAERAEVTRLADAVPTIMVTARTWAEQNPAAHLGLLAILGKPFDLDEPSAVISSWVAELSADGAEARAQARDLRGRTDDALGRLRAQRAKMSRPADSHPGSAGRKNARRRDR